MAKVAVLRDRDGKIIGVMRGSYTLLPGWVEEDDTGQQVEIPLPLLPPTPARIKLKDLQTGEIREYEIITE